MTKVPHWILRRFASRAIHILQRLEADEPSLALYLKTLGLTAPSYLDAYRAMVAYEQARSLKIIGRDATIESLLRKLRTWTAVLAQDLGIDTSEYGDRPAVPEEVINDTIQLLAVIARHEQEGHEMPFYTEELRNDLSAALETAQTQLVAAGGSHVTLAKLRDDLRTAATAFQRDLVTFRRALKAFFGSSHPDYQRLRMPRTVQDMIEDEADPRDDIDTAPDASSVGNEPVDVDDDSDEEAIPRAS